MVLEYTIVGGTIQIPKSIFVQEMLSKDSKMKILLNMRNVKGFTTKSPMIKEADQNQNITIDFTGTNDLTVYESPKDILGHLKAKYREKIKGRITCRVTYSAYGGVFVYQLDLNSDGDQVEYITN